MDLLALLQPETPPVEIFVRGSVTYLALFLFLRLASKRQSSGSMGMTDLLVIVLIADAAQNAMAGDYNTITDGLLLVATIIFWAYAVDWLGFRIPIMGRLVHPGPLPLIEDGRLDRANMRSELVTHEELMSQLRRNGFTRIADVERAYLEGNGQLTVVGQTKRKAR